MPVVGEGLAASQPDPFPRRRGQRGRGDDEGVDRRHVAAMTGEPTGVPLGRSHHGSRRNAPRRRVHAPGLEGRRPGVLVDRDPARSERVGQPPGQPERVDGRTVRREGRPQRPRGVQQLAASVASSSRNSSASMPQLRACCELPTGPGELGARPEERHGATASDVGVDPQRGGRHDHLVDRAPHRGVLGQRGLPSGERGERVEGGGEERRAPAAVATGRAVPHGLGLDQCDPQGGVGLGEVVSRPQSGEPGADDSDVDRGVPGERGPGNRWWCGVGPERARGTRSWLSGRPTSRSACGA